MPSTFRWFGLKRKADCNSCKACAKGCGAQAIDADGRIDHRECLHCLDCMILYTDDHTCPPLSKERKQRERDGKPLTAIGRDGYFIPIVPIEQDRQYQHAAALLAREARPASADRRGGAAGGRRYRPAASLGRDLGSPVAVQP